MGADCAPLVADLFLFCYESGFMMSLSDISRLILLMLFNTTARYFCDIININNLFLF